MRASRMRSNGIAMLDQVALRSDLRFARWHQELLHVLAIVKLWRQRQAQRRQLTQLPDFMLKDIGITRVDARQEADKPFWQA